jgi:uncharacterized protein YciI
MPPMPRLAAARAALTLLVALGAVMLPACAGPAEEPGAGGAPAEQAAGGEPAPREAALGEPTGEEPAAATPSATETIVEAEAGLSHYQLVLLRRGPSWTAEQTPETLELQARHLEHLGELYEAGKLVLAGPTDQPAAEREIGGLAGILVFATPAEEALAFAAEDPAVQAGRLSVEIYPWMATSKLAELKKE